MISLPRPLSVAGLAGAAGAGAVTAPVQPLLPLPPAVHGLVLGVVALHGYAAGVALALLAGTSGRRWAVPVAAVGAAAVLVEAGPVAAAGCGAVLVVGVLAARLFRVAALSRARRFRPPAGSALAACLLVALPVGTAAAAPALVGEVLGAEGRSFLAAPPPGGTAPLRVYAGLGSAPTVLQRVERALAALDAAHGLSRSTVLVAVPTGSGWVNRSGVGALERLTGGDTTTVVLQYAQRPSWLEYALGTGAAEESATALVRALRGRIDALPATHRPRLLVYGESLGALGAAAAAAGADGVLVAGTPAGAWLRGSVRAVLHPDDPVAWFSPQLLVARPPGWPGEWLPVVSFWTTAGSLLTALDAPVGHGHRYGDGEFGAGWRTVLRAAQPLTAPEARPAT
jgi:uncharacterized membrane protein